MLSLLLSTFARGGTGASRCRECPKHSITLARSTTTHPAPPARAALPAAVQPPGAH